MLHPHPPHPAGKNVQGAIPATLISIGAEFERATAQPVDATPYNQLLRQYFQSRIDLYGGTQSESKRGFILIELTPANEISLVDSYTKTLSKCCVDPLKPPRLSGPSGADSIGRYQREV